MPFHPAPGCILGEGVACAAQAEGDRPALTLHDASDPSAPGPTLLCGARPKGQLQTSPLLTLGQLQGLEGQPVILWGWLGAHSDVQAEAAAAEGLGTCLAVGVTLEEEQDSVPFDGSQK